LDRACCQFEPDDQNYHRVVFSTYQHVDQTQKYQILESTRHLGPLLFYLVFNKRPDNFLMYCLQTERYILYQYIYTYILNPTIVLKQDKILDLMM
jgi:small subunit ribosomal protein S22